MSAKFAPDKAPVAPEIEGWEAKYIGDEPRLSEQVELFHEIRFETRIESFDPEKSEGCTKCFKNSPTPVMVLYVRKIDSVNKEAEDELF